MMTTIVYAITLRNGDGVTATSATQSLEYPDVPSEHLQGMVAQNIENLERSHRAMLELVKQQPAQTFARKEKRAK